MAVFHLLSQMSDPRIGWLPVVLMIIIGLGFAIGTVAISVILGPGRTGPGKQIAYESGMVPTGDARRRFNVRFYIVAMIFLVFDVEIVFFYPWATLFPEAVVQNACKGFILLVELLIFVGILLIAYLYAWGKGVFRWD